MRHRYYDPELGRFLTRNPYGYVDGPNLYQYALNDLVNLSDPTGELVWCLAAGGVGALAGWGISAAVGVEYDWGDAAIDFAVGTLTCGVGVVGARAGYLAATTVGRKSL